MKKNTRILAVLLTLCMLIGAVAVFASAATVSQLDASQYGTGISNYLAADFENNDKIKSFISQGNGSKKDGTTVLSFSTYASVNNMATSTVGDETNTFMRITSKDQATPGVIEDAKNFPFWYMFVNPSKNDAISGKYDYVTLDFDFAALGEGEYLESAYFGPYMVKDAYPANIYTVTDGTDWYLSNKSTYADGGSKVRISAEHGVWNHVTYIIDVKGASNGKMPIYVYVNGALLHKFSVTLAATTEVQRLSVGFSKYMANEKFCYGVDNIVSNKYAVGYTSSGNGIDDFLAGGAVGSPEVLSDVVYQSGYTYLAAKDSQFYTVDGKKYALASDAAKAIKNGSTVEIYRDLYVSSCDASSFTVNAHNGAKLSTGSGMFINEKVSEADGVAVYKFRNIVAEAPAGAVDQAQHIYDDGNLKYNTYLEYTGNFQAAIEGLGSNKFVQITDASTATLPKNALFRIPLVDTLGSKTEQLRTSFDYQVLDFDFSTSSNYYTSISFGLYKNVSNTWSWLGNIKDVGSGNYQLLSDEDEPKSIPLSTDVCDWTHMTVVIEGATGNVDIYVNGEYFFSDVNISNTDRAERLDIFFKMNTTVHDFTFNIDNVILRSFNKGYSSGNDVFGIDDYKALGDNTLPVYELGDTVYGPYYGYESCTPVPYAASIGADNYYVATGAFLDAKDGDTITLKKDVTLMNPLSDSINTLKIEGANVILKGEAARLYSYADGVLSKNPLYTLNVYDENEEIAFTAKFDVSVAPNLSLININTSVLGDYKQDLAWSFKVNDGESKPLSAWEAVEQGSVVSLIPEITPVAWFDDGGNMIGDTEQWFIGSTASHGFDELDELDPLENGYYELSYFWNGNADDPYDLTVYGNDSFFAIVKPVEAFDLSSLKLNFTLGERFFANYYVPVPSDDEITVTGYKHAPNLDPQKPGSEDGYYDDLIEAVSNSINITTCDIGSIVQIGGSDYYKCVGSSLSAYAWYAANGFEVTFTVEYDDEVYEISSKVAASRLGAKDKDYAKVLSYANAIINGNECGSEAKSLMLNWMKYIDLSYLSQGNNVHIEGLATSLNKHTDCGCLTDITSALKAEAPESDMSAIAALAKGFAATYKMDYNKGTFLLYVPKDYADSCGELKVYSKFVGIDNASASIKEITANFVRLQVLDEENSTEENEVYVDDTKTVDGVVCYVYGLDAKIGIYNMNAVHTVTVEVDGAAVASGTYSLLNYVQNLNEKVGLYTYDEESGKYVVDSSLSETTYTTDQHSVNIALALANFANAAYNFKVN